MARISAPLPTIVLATAMAICFPAIMVGLSYAPPLLFGGLRALLGGVALLTILAIQRRPVLPPRATWAWLPLLAASGTTLAFMGMFLSPGQTGVASILANLQPLLVVALAVPLLGEQITRNKAAALVVGTAGVVLVSWSSLTGTHAIGINGPALALMASAGAALGTVLAKRMGPQPSILALAGWQLILGSLPLLAGWSVFEGSTTVTWGPMFIGVLVLLALAGTALPASLWYWLLGRSGAGQSALSLFLVPISGVGLAAGISGSRSRLARWAVSSSSSLAFSSRVNLAFLRASPSCSSASAIVFIIDH